MKHKTLKSVVVAVAGFVMPAMAASVPATFTPVADGFVREAEKNTVLSYESAQVKTQKGYSREMYMNFDLTGNTVTCNQATLSLNCVAFAPEVANIDIEVYGVAGSYCTADLTWETRPEEQLEYISTISINPTEHAGKRVEWNISPFVKKMLSEGTPQFTLVLKAVNTVSTFSMVTFSTSKIPANSPQIVVSEEVDVQTVDCSPVVDGFLRESPGSGSSFPSGVEYAELKNSKGVSREIYMDFDLKNVTIDCNKATFSIHCISFDKTDIELELMLYGAAGLHCTSGLTWATRLDSELEYISSIRANSTEHTGVRLEWDATEFVRNMLSEGKTQFTLVLRSETSACLMKMSTNESGNGPLLSVSNEAYVPEEPKTFATAPLFTDNMVLQRDEPIVVWGVCEPGASVSVQFDGVVEQTVTGDEQGNWKATLAARPADGATAHTLSVECDGTSLSYENVVMGDVWMMSGQSNMSLKMVSVEPDQLEEAKADAEYPDLRYYDVVKIVNGGAIVEGNDKAWIGCNATRMVDWSAIAFFFGRDVHKTQNVPVGLISCNHGGSTAEAFISEEAFAADAVLNAAKCPDSTDPLFALYQNPSSVFNGMVKKLVGYSIKGVVWYQGEANAKYSKNYETVFKGLIADWRNQWNRPELPFIFVQLPAYNRTDEPGGSSWSEVREAQLNTWLSIPHTAMAVAMDAGDLTNIHPANKKPVADRLVRCARGMVYGEEVIYKSPVFRSIENEGSVAVLSFDNLTGAWSATKEISEFELCGEDGIYHPATAEISGENIRVSAADVAMPKGVRYAWSNVSTISLYDESGLPLPPFRNNYQPESKNSVIAFDEMAGVYSSSVYSGGNRTPQMAVDGSGLNSSGEHSATPNNTAWHSSDLGLPVDFKIQLKQADFIDGLHIWNLNGAAPFTNRGAKSVEVYVSNTSRDLSEVPFTEIVWTKVADLELAMADGTASYLGEAFVLDIAGRVNWIGLNILSNHSESDKFTGLSEVQLLRGEDDGTGDFETPKGAIVLFDEMSGVYASSSYSAGNRTPQMAVDGSGLSADGAHSAAPNNTAWHSSESGFPAYFKIGLKDEEVIAGINVWNLNGASPFTGRGAREVEVYVANTSRDLSEVPFSDADWTRVTALELAMADGKATYTGEHFDLDITGKINWFALNILSNHSDGTDRFVGLSEIQLVRGEDDLPTGIAGETESSLNCRWNGTTLYVENRMPVQVSVCDLRGVVCLSETVTGAVAYELGEWQPGLYILTMVSENRKEIRKLWVK